MSSLEEGGLSSLAEELLSAEDSLQECCKRIEQRFEDFVPQDSSNVPSQVELNKRRHPKRNSYDSKCD